MSEAIKLSDLEKDGWEGSDADLRTSLEEYGMAWRSIPSATKKEYKFYYATGYDGKNYDLFDWGSMTEEEFDDLLTGKNTWVDLEEVKKYCGKDIDGQEFSFPYDVSSLVSYYGFENIFGSSSGPGFKIDWEA